MAPPTLESELPYLTTYSHIYNRKSAVSLPPILYRDLPSLVRGVTRPDTDSVVPPGPRRRLTRERPICVGLGTTDLNTQRYLGKKPIVNALPPNKVINVLPKIDQSSDTLSDLAEGTGTDRSEILKCLSTDLQWTTTYVQAGRGASIPMRQACPPRTTFEEHTDRVKYRPCRYEAKCINWQNLTGVWDPKQLRRRTGDTRSPVLSRGNKNGDVSRKSKSAKKNSTGVSEESKAAETVVSSPLLRPCPGYAGYVPRETVELNGDVIHDPESPFATSMRTTYRKIPPAAFRTSPFAHRGPLCRTVTLTYPFNPFNKTE